MLTTEETELLELADAATPGPWRYDGVDVDQLTDSGQGYPLDVYPDSAMVVRGKCDECGDLTVAIQRRDDAVFIAAANPARVRKLLDTIGGMRGALTKVSSIRDSIVGMQGFNFSEHAYPLVAVLDAAGFKGAGYEIARKNLGTLIEQIKTAEAERDEARKQLDARIQWQAVAVAHMQVWRGLFDAAITMKEGHEGCLAEPACGECFRCKFDAAVDEALAAIAAGSEVFVDRSDAQKLLEAMTTARDEACAIADDFILGKFLSTARTRDEGAARIAELRKVGAIASWPVTLDLHSATPTHPYGHGRTWVGSVGVDSDEHLSEWLSTIAGHHPNVHYIDSAGMRRRWHRDPKDSSRLVEIKDGR